MADIKLSVKQQKFALAYVESGNATQSYKDAGYKAKNDDTANVLASRLLRNDKVSAYIDELLAEMKSPKIADATEVLEYLTAVMRGETYSEVVVVEGSGDGYSEARRIEKAPDEKERLKSAELLGKRYRLFTDKIEVKDADKVVFSGESELED